MEVGILYDDTKNIDTALVKRYCKLYKRYQYFILIDRNVIKISLFV